MKGSLVVSARDVVYVGINKTAADGTIFIAAKSCDYPVEVPKGVERAEIHVDLTSPRDG